MYDPSKENDKDVLKEFTSHMHERILELERKVIELEKKNALDDAIKIKLSEELLNIRERVFNSKQEKKSSNKKQKKRKKGKLPHNKNSNEKIDDEDVELDEEVIPYQLEDESICPSCGGDKLHKMNDCFEESSEIEVIERKYIIKHRDMTTNSNIHEIWRKFFLFLRSGTNVSSLALTNKVLL